MILTLKVGVVIGALCVLIVDWSLLCMAHALHVLGVIGAWPFAGIVCGLVLILAWIVAGSIILVRGHSS